MPAQSKSNRPFHPIFSCFLILSISLNAGFSADPKNEPDDTVDSTTQPLKYAIVIHGGAGSSPDQFSDAKNDARRNSLKTALNKGVAVLKNGGTSLKAVEAVIREIIGSTDQHEGGQRQIVRSAERHCTNGGVSVRC